MVQPNIHKYNRFAQPKMFKFLSITMIISPHIRISLLTIVPLTTLAFPAQSISVKCENPNYYSTGYSMRGSSEESNLNLLMSSLILNINTPRTGFVAPVIGEPPHQVYGLAQCCSDISNESCTSCLLKASQYLLRSCLYDNGGIAYFDQCAVRYSADNFFFQLSTIEQHFAGCMLLGPPNEKQFKKQIFSMVKSISQIAAFNKTVRMFATGVNTQVYNSSRVYGMVQCARDLSEHQCYKCLRQSFYCLSSVCVASWESILVA
ncbi:cysteine-rich RECEPTOR-like kinase [Rhynchospora pubera]|uniref:Cysteine-rich RECEPTOR-like kinase n=1 Tax=Rhynchospora pubera TaxID=906938 RepID=A0AAV8BR22_9POAL|nr:cysteine-rich RECEPTOR-like kinase [Rhynchospora pubera]